MPTKQTKNSQYAYRARQEAEAEQRALYEEPLWEGIYQEAYATSDEELECLLEADSLQAERALAEIWASIAFSIDEDFQEDL